MKVQVNTRITKDVKDKLKEKAESKGMTVSEYIRFLITKDLETK